MVLRTPDSVHVSDQSTRTVNLVELTNDGTDVSKELGEC